MRASKASLDELGSSWVWGRPGGSALAGGGAETDGAADAEGAAARIGTGNSGGAMDGEALGVGGSPREQQSAKRPNAAPRGMRAAMLTIPAALDQAPHL